MLVNGSNYRFQVNRGNGGGLFLISDGDTISNDDTFAGVCKECFCDKRELLCGIFPCCIHAGPYGNGIERALPGEGFFDGCNFCMCGSDGLRACSKNKIGCRNKCSYTSRQGVTSYILLTETTSTYDAETGCMLHDCQCVRGKAGNSMVCPKVVECSKFG